MNIDGKMKDKSSNWSLFFEQLDKFNRFMEYTFSLPMKILDNGIDNIQSFATNHTVTCSICLCASITATISITSIAIGLGVGLGVGCTKTNIIYQNSTNG